MMEKEGMISQKSRRDFLKKAAYVAPAVLTLSATPALATNGSPSPICKHPNGEIKERISRIREVIEKKSDSRLKFSGLKTSRLSKSNRRARFGR